MSHYICLSILSIHHHQICLSLSPRTKKKSCSSKRQVQYCVFDNCECHLLPSPSFVHMESKYSSSIVFCFHSACCSDSHMKKSQLSSWFSNNSEKILKIQRRAYVYPRRRGIKSRLLYRLACLWMTLTWSWEGAKSFSSSFACSKAKSSSG